MTGRIIEDYRMNNNTSSIMFYNVGLENFKL